MVLLTFLFPPLAFSSEVRIFQPQDCEFRTLVDQDAEIKSKWRGENLLTTATQKSEDGVLRAACGAYHVRDWGAFRRELPGQLRLAARMAGVNEPRTAIRMTRDGVVASYWGYRGSGEHRTFFRSDSYVGSHSYMEIVVMAPGQASYSGSRYQVRRVSR